MPNPIPQLPPQVMAKLADRGVTDDEGLVAAMQADAVLRAEVQTFLAENQGQIQQWIVRDLLAVQNSQELTDLVVRAPLFWRMIFSPLWGSWPPLLRSEGMRRGRRIDRPAGQSHAHST